LSRDQVNAQEPAKGEAYHRRERPTGEFARTLQLPFRANAGGVKANYKNGVLTIEGKARLDSPQGCQWVGQEYGVGRYRRDFTLSDAVDVDGVKARVRQGVLEVTLPKREKVKIEA